MKKEDAEKNRNKNKKIDTNIIIIRIILTIIVLVLLITIVYMFFPYVMNLYSEKGQLEFKEKVESLGFIGFLMLFGLQVLQILLVVLPGEPLEILAGMCYGAWGGLLFVLLSVFITTTIIFFSVRKYGKKLIYNFFSEEKIDKIEKSKLFNNPKKIETILFILFFIPGTPKDLLIYIGGVLPVNSIKFILISTFARFPSVISSTLAGASLSKGHWKLSIIIYIVTFIITGVIIFLVNRKDKTSEKIVEILK